MRLCACVCAYLCRSLCLCACIFLSAAAPAQYCTLFSDNDPSRPDLNLDLDKTTFISNNRPPQSLLTLTGIGHRAETLFCPVTHFTPLHVTAQRCSSDGRLRPSPTPKRAHGPVCPRPNRREFGYLHTLAPSTTQLPFVCYGVCKRRPTSARLDIYDDCTLDVRLLARLPHPILTRLDTLTWHHYSTIYMTTRTHCCSTLTATRTRA